MNTTSPLPQLIWRRRVAGVALAGVLSLGALSACGGMGGSGDSADTASGGDSGMTEQMAPANDADAAAKQAYETTQSARTGVDQKLVRRASLQLKVDSLTESATRIRGIASTQGGSVVSEELYSEDTGRTTSGTMTISVPAASLDGTIALIEKVGDVQYRTSSAEDVTATYVDTEARVKSLTASVERVRALLSKASTVTDLVALENELSQRQADLDALTAQLDSLKDQVAQSPLTISMSTDDFEPVSAGGFLAGLKAGWSAFLGSLAVLVTVIGAVLPFAVALGLVAAPIVWFLRRRRRATAAPLVPTVGPATAPAPPPSAS